MFALNVLNGNVDKYLLVSTRDSPVMPINFYMWQITFDFRMGEVVIVYSCVV